MFGNVVLDIPRLDFEEEMDNLKYEKGFFEDSELQVRRRRKRRRSEG